MKEMQPSGQSNINLPQDAVVLKSLENANQAISLLTQYLVKNEALQSEIMRNQILISHIKKNLDELNVDIKKHYPEDKVIMHKINNIVDNSDIVKIAETVKDIRLAMGLMKIIAANITQYSGQPDVWYKYTDVVKRIEDKVNNLP
jgi:hypothetical protein